MTTPPLLLSLALGAVHVAGPLSRPPRRCSPFTPAHSNLTSTPCEGTEGSECAFDCTSGYFRVGSRLVCQEYTTVSGATAWPLRFHGSRCERCCAGAVGCGVGSDCPPGTVPVRGNSSDASGPCFASRCLPTDTALRKMARGAYEVWRLVRDPRTGIYSDSADVVAPASAQSDRAHIGINGVALMFEAVAAEMGWQTRAEAQARVELSLSALAGELPGFRLTRQQPFGWIPTFFNRTTGEAVGRDQPFTVLDSGLNSAGALFAGTYFAATSAANDRTPDQKAASQRIASLSRKVFESVQFERILCTSEGVVAGDGADDGVTIPFTITSEGANASCGALHFPAGDGFYDFSELHYSVWLAYKQACGRSPPGKCANGAIERMWQGWQGRRQHPDVSWTDATTGRSYPLLSLWPSYIVQLPFFSSHSFNTDPQWTALFDSHWAADLAYYKTSAYYAGDRGRYGLAAGFTDFWCSAKASGYEADMLVIAGSKQDVPGAQGCKMYSPYAIAGYLPAAPQEITSHLLALLADGESVVNVPGTGTPGDGEDYVLLRKSMIEPGWNQTTQVSLVDFSSELFGLSTLWLGVDFWQRYTNHTW